MPSNDTAQPEGPSRYRQAVELEFAEATKRYGGAEAAAVDGLSLTGKAAQVGLEAALLWLVLGPAETTGAPG